ncbi:MAG: TolC family protein [bacterium]|nr:TolC family protein [bacterium]
MQVAFAETQTVDVPTSGLSIPGGTSESDKDAGGEVDPLKVLPQDEGFVEIPVATAPLSSTSPDIQVDGDRIQQQISSSLSMLDYLGDTSDVEGRVLTLDEATERALENNPELISLALEVDAQLARILQARVKPSPEIGISLSEFLGMNDRRGVRHSVSELTYSKVVEKLDKRLARARVARLSGEVARWDYEAALRNIHYAVARAYVEVLVAQELMKVNLQLFQLTEGVRGAVALRYEAGTVSELELSRLDIELENARISFEQSEAGFDAARKRLAALWGDTVPDFAAVAGNISGTQRPLDTLDVEGLLPDNPVLARFASETLARQATLQLALAEGHPDYTVTGGVQGFGDTGEMALTVGISVPTKKRGLNPGDVREAEIRVEQLESLREAARLRLQAQLVDALARLRAAYMRSQSLRDKIVPAALDNLDRTIIGYRYGKFSYLDVLESERTLVEAVGAYVDALAEYQLARVDIERVIGRPLPLSEPEVTAEPNSEETNDTAVEGELVEAEIEDLHDSQGEVSEQ